MLWQVIEVGLVCGRWMCRPLMLMLLELLSLFLCMRDLSAHLECSDILEMEMCHDMILLQVIWDSVLDKCY